MLKQALHQDLVRGGVRGEDFDDLVEEAIQRQRRRVDHLLAS
jgi:hypothetical protein